MTSGKARRKLMENEMLDQAADLFARRGFDGTTLQEIAQTMHISRAALYHYIDSKEELLVELVKGLSDEIADNLGSIAESGLSPSEKLRQAISTTAANIASNASRYRLLAISESALPREVAEEQVAARERSLEFMTEMTREAVNSGVARPLDEQVAAFGMLGACHYIAWWGHLRPDLRPAELGSILAHAITGLLFEVPRSENDAIAAIRENLDFLERQLEGSGSGDLRTQAAGDPAAGS
jgi:AcrR family transcriptional regulator